MMLVYLQCSELRLKKGSWFTYNAASSVLRSVAGLLTIQEVLFYEIMLLFWQCSKFCLKKWCWFTYNEASGVLKNADSLLTTKEVLF